MSSAVALGSWVVHPKHGVGQVIDVWVLDKTDIERPTYDDGVVLVALVDGKRCVRVYRDALSLVDEPAVAS